MDALSCAVWCGVEVGSRYGGSSSVRFVWVGDVGCGIRVVRQMRLVRLRWLDSRWEGQMGRWMMGRLFWHGIQVLGSSWRGEKASWYCMYAWDVYGRVKFGGGV